MSLQNKLERIVLDLEDLIESISNTEAIEELTKIKDELNQIYLTEEI